MEGKEKTMFDKLKLRIMRNWCKSMYVIDGDAKEVRELYELMKGLQRRKEPFVRNGFGMAGVSFERSGVRVLLHGELSGSLVPPRNGWRYLTVHDRNNIVTPTFGI